MYPSEGSSNKVPVHGWAGGSAWLCHVTALFASSLSFMYFIITSPSDPGLLPFPFLNYFTRCYNQNTYVAFPDSF